MKATVEVELPDWLDRDLLRLLSLLEPQEREQLKGFLSGLLFRGGKLDLDTCVRILAESKKKD